MSWELKKLNEVVLVKSGKRLPKGHNFVSAETNHPYIRARDIKNGKIKIEEPVYISDNTFNIISRYTVSENDVVITIVGANVGDIAFIDSEHHGANLTENAAKLISKDINALSPKFLKYSLFGDVQKSKFQQIAMAAAQPKLGLYKIKDFEIRTPDIQTQKRIADILSAYDDLIENNLKRIELLEQAAQNIYKEWFVNLRFPGHEHTPIDDETGLPMEWKTLKFDNVFNLQNGYAFKSKDYKNNGISVLRTRDYSSSFFIDITDPVFLSYEFSVSHKKYFIKELDFLLIMVGASIGKNGLVLKKDLPALQNQNQWAIRVKSKFHSYDYFKIYCVKSIIDSLLMKRTGSARDFFRASFIKEIDVVIPNENLVKQFTKFVKPLINQINILLTQNQKLKSARDILLPRLMNRTIEV